MKVGRSTNPDSFDTVSAEKQRLEETQIALLNLLEDLQSVERLRRLERLKDRFVAFASHEMRTPLTSIHGFSSTLVDRWDELSDEDRRSFVMIIDEQAERMRRMLDDMLVMTRINSGALVVDRRTVDLRREVDKVVAEFGIDGIEVTCPEHVLVRVDPRHLHQALVNYLGNAFKYGDKPIEIKAVERAGWVDLLVCDNGPGIDAAFLPHLFEEFARAERHDKSTQAGSGLGLAIVRRLMQAQEVDVWFEPNEPSGACFGLRLPIALDDGPDAAESS